MTTIKVVPKLKKITITIVVTGEPRRSNENGALMSYTNPGYVNPPSGMGALSTDGDDDDKKKKKKTTKKVVDRQIILAIIFACLVAVLIAFVVMTANKGTYAVQAKANINAATVLTPDLFQAVKTPEDAIVDGAFTGTSEADALSKLDEAIAGGSVTNQPIPARGQITPDLLGAGAALATPLAPDERLFSTTATVARAVAGGIKAGDMIDVVGTVNGVNGIVARNVQVISATVSENQFESAASSQSGGDKDKQANELLPGKPIPGTYILRVKEGVALDIIAARESGELNFLYNGTDAANVPTQPVTGPEVVQRGGR